MSDNNTDWAKICSEIVVAAYGTEIAGDPVPCVVLDPFSGAGTVGLVASRLGRRHIGVELSLEYCRMAENRIYQDAPLLAGVTL